MLLIFLSEITCTTSSENRCVSVIYVHRDVKFQPYNPAKEMKIKFEDYGGRYEKTLLGHDTFCNRYPLKTYGYFSHWFAEILLEICHHIIYILVELCLVKSETVSNLFHFNDSATEKFSVLV